MKNNVKLIIANISFTMGKEEKILSMIAPCYAKKYREIKIQEEARQELISGYLLKEYLGIDLDEQLIYQENQKPALAAKTVFFNLSHSGELVVLAMADCDVGVDVEKIRPCHEATIKKVFNEKQKQELQQLEGTVKNERFTKIWTSYEALLKLKGVGFGEGWELEKDATDCSMYTTQIGAYFLSCATQKEAAFAFEIL